MSIADAKRELSQGGIQERRETTPSPAPKSSPASAEATAGKKATGGEEKKKEDTSIFKEQPGLERNTFDYRLTDPNLYSTTKLEKDRIEELGEKAFGSSRYIKPSDLKDAKDQLNLGKWGRFKGLSEQDKKDLDRLIDGLSGN